MVFTINADRETRGCNASPDPVNDGGMEANIPQSLNNEIPIQRIKGFPQVNFDSTAGNPSLAMVVMHVLLH